MKELDDLTHAVAKLEQVNRQLEEYARVVSHELKAPLRRIQGFTAILQEECPSDNPEVVEALAFIHEGIQSMEHVIDTLLRFARTDFDAQSSGSVDVGEVFAHVRRILKVQISQSKAEITADPLPCVHANRILIEQLLVNLVSNGIKFNKNPVPKVHLSVTLEGSWARFSVSDNGEGIAPEHVSEVFGMFRRFHSAYEGSGVGLAFCRRIVEAHGGQMGLDTELGEGSTFWFTLPLCQCDGT